MAARFEVASLLESRCDAGDLLNLIKAGVEGPHVLSMVPDAQKSNRESSAPESWVKVEDKDESRRDLFSDFEDWEKEVERQQAILDSLAVKKELPPWASQQAERSKASGARRDSRFGVASSSGEGKKTEAPFSKKAVLQPASVTPVLVRAIAKAREGEKPKTPEGKQRSGRFRKASEPSSARCFNWMWT